MIVTTTRVWLMALLLGLLGMGGTLVQTVHAQSLCPPNSQQDFCSGAYWLMGNLSPISGRSSGLNVEFPAIEKPTLPAAGALIYSDYVKIEQRAHRLLAKAILMRESISPYREDNDFDTFLRALDAKAEWETDPLPNGGKVGEYTATSFANLVTQIEKDLTEARDLYAFLAVFAPEADFRKDNAYINNNGDKSFCGAEDQEDPNPQSDPTKPTVLPPVIDWCNFQARLRQSVREVVNVRMLVGQEFMVDALGVNFSTNTVGGEMMVREEVAKLRAARYQFERAEAFLTDGLTRAVGNGCLISDFYTQTEWSLLTRAATRQGTTQYHIATRESYLNVDNVQSVAQAQTVAQQTLRQSTNDAHIKLIGLVGLGAPVTQHCQIGERPDGDLVAELALSQLETRRRSQEMAAGLNIFGFDVTMTPARPYISSSPGNCTLPQGDRGLWDEAYCRAVEARTKQIYEEDKTRAFDISQEKLITSINEIRQGLDTEIYKVSGCDRNTTPNDADFFTCTQKQIDEAEECWRLAAIDPAVDATKLDPPAKYSNFEACMVPGVNWEKIYARTDIYTALSKLRSDYLAYQAIKKSAENINEQIQNSNDANATVTAWLGIAGAEETAARVSQAALDAVACIDFAGLDFVKEIKSAAACSIVGGANIALQAVAGAYSTAADVEIAKAENTKEIKNLLLQMSELLIDAQSVYQAFLSTQSDVGGFIDLLQFNLRETQRQRAYFATSPANDPSFRIVRDSARLKLAEELEMAARISYLAARRAEYEYAARLAANGFAISDIYRARTADDIIDYLNKLQGITSNLPGSLSNSIIPKDLKISVAQDILLLTDDLLRSEGFATAEAITAERTRRFRLWVAENTVRNDEDDDNKPVLRFTFSTSLLDGGLFSNLFGQTYDNRWLLKLTEVDSRKGSNGVSINLVSEEINLSYRDVVMKQGGTVHMKSFFGCVFDYRLIAPAALLGREWPEGQKAELVLATFSANVNDSHAYTENSYRTSVFGGRAISATDWEIAIFASTPQASLGLPDMDLQRLTDIQLNLSITYASRGNTGQPEPADCARIDY